MDTIPQMPQYEILIDYDTLRVLALLACLLRSADRNISVYVTLKSLRGYPANNTTNDTVGTVQVALWI